MHLIQLELINAGGAATVDTATARRLSSFGLSLSGSDDALQRATFAQSACAMALLVIPHTPSTHVCRAHAVCLAQIC